MATTDRPAPIAAGVVELHRPRRSRLDVIRDVLLAALENEPPANDNDNRQPSKAKR